MNTDKNKQVAEILGSLDGLKSASAPDFFYTRLRARMEKGLEPAMVKKRALYPVFALAAVILVVFINAVILYSRQDTNATDTATLSETDNLQSIAAEYNIAAVSSIYDLNEER